MFCVISCVLVLLWGISCSSVTVVVFTVVSYGVLMTARLTSSVLLGGGPDKNMKFTLTSYVTLEHTACSV